MTYTIGITCFIFGMLLLIVFSHFHFPNLLYIYALFFSLGYAVVSATSPLVTADFFEGKIYGTVFGMIMMFSCMGMAFAAWFAAFIHDRLGTYVPVFLGVIVCVSFSWLSLWIAAPIKIRVMQKKRKEIHSIGNH